VPGLEESVCWRQQGSKEFTGLFVQQVMDEVYIACRHENL